MRTHAINSLVTFCLGILLCANLFLIHVPIDARLILISVCYLIYTQFYKVSAFSLSVFSSALLLIFYKDIPAEFVPNSRIADLGSHAFTLFIYAAIILLALFSTLVGKWMGWWKNSLLWLWGYFVILPYLVRLMPFTEAYQSQMKNVWMAVGHCWWYFIFLIQDASYAPSNSFSRIGFLFPVTQFIVTQTVISPFALGPKAFSDYSCALPLASQRRNCLGFLFLTFGFTAVPFVQHRWFPMVSPVFEFSRDFFAGKISLRDYIISGAVNLISLYAYAFGVWNLMAALFRIGGFHFPAGMNPRVLKSRDFSEFFGFFMHYAKEIFVQLFFFPIFLALKNISNVRYRVVLSTFVSLCVGATLYHVAISPNGRSPLFERGFFYSVFDWSIGSTLGFLLTALLIVHAQWRRFTYGPPKMRPPVVQFFFLCQYFGFVFLSAMMFLWPRGIPLTKIIEVLVGSY